jgi:hypothetical protein
MAKQRQSFSYFLIILIFCCHAPLSAQAISGEEPRINWGIAMPKSGKEDFTKMLGIHRDQLIILKRDKRNIFENDKWNLEIIAENNLSKKEIVKIPLTLKDGATELSLEKILLLKNNIIIIAGLKQKKNKSLDLFYALFNSELKSFSNFSALLSIPLIESTNRESEKITTCIGGDEFYLLYQSLNPSGEKSIQILQYNAGVELLNSKSINLSPTNKEFSLDTTLVGEDGTLFFALNSTFERNSYTLVSTHFTKNKTNIVELEIPKMELSSLHLIAEKNQLFAGGLLKEKKKNASPSAFYTAIFDENLNLNRPLQFTDINSLEEKGEKSKDKNREWLDLKSLKLIKVNSGVFLVAEQQRVENICISDFRTGFIRCNDYYYFIDVLCIFAGIDVPSWKTTIHKYQSSIDDEGLFGSVLVVSDYENKCTLLFNDHQKNFGKPNAEIKSMSNPGKSHCVSVSLNTNGELIKNHLYSSKEQNIVLLPQIYMEKRKLEFYVYGEKSGTSRIGKLGLP